MDAQFPADVSRSIESLLATGRYTSSEEVLRAALDALQQRDEDFLAIATGVEEMERGRYRSFAEADAGFRRAHDIPREE